ncbi:hypothetical protein KIPB_011618, partial [Kipferlia bialata]
DTVHGMHVEAKCTVESMPCPYPKPGRGEWGFPSHFQRVGTDLFHLCDKGFYKLDCAARAREWSPLGAVPEALNAILNPKMTDAPRSHRLYALDGDLYLLAQCNEIVMHTNGETYGTMTKAGTIYGHWGGKAHFWRFDIESGQWHCLPSGSIPNKVMPESGVVVGSRLYCGYGYGGSTYCDGVLSYSPPSCTKDSLSAQGGSDGGWTVPMIKRRIWTAHRRTGPSFPQDPVPVGRYIVSSSGQGFYDTVTDEVHRWGWYDTGCDALGKTFGPREGAVYTSLMTDHATGCTIEDAARNKEVYLQVVQFDTDALVL